MDYYIKRVYQFETMHPKCPCVEKTPILRGSLNGLIIPKMVEINGKSYAELQPYASLHFYDNDKGKIIYDNNEGKIISDMSEINYICGELINFKYDFENYNVVVSYYYEEEHRKDTYYIDGKFGVMGHLVACGKCGRKIIVENVLIGTNHNISVIAKCADCFEISETFRRDYPNDAEEIEALVNEWKKQ